MFINTYLIVIGQGTLFGMGFLALGWLVLYGSVVKYRELNLIRNTPTSKIRSLAMGTVEIKGKPEKFKKEFKSPFSDTPCLLYRYVIEKYIKDDDSSNWSTVETGMKTAKFYIKDDTGKVLVDPEGAEVQFGEKNQNTYTFENDEEKPKKIKDFLEKRKEIFKEKEDFGLSGMVKLASSQDIRLGNADNSIDKNDKTRYKEEFLPKDSDDIYIIGSAMEREGVQSPKNVENIIIGEDENTPTFKISNKSEKSVISSTYKTTLSGIAFGIIFSLVGFGILLKTSGIIIGMILSSFTLVIAYLFNEKYSENKDEE